MSYNDVLVNDRPYIWQWSHKILMDLNIVYSPAILKPSWYCNAKVSKTNCVVEMANSLNLGVDKGNTEELDRGDSWEID